MILTRVHEALRFWWNYLGPLLVITAPFALAGEAMQLWQGSALKLDEEGVFQGFTAISVVTLVLLQPFSEGALIARLEAIEQGVQRTFVDCVLVGARVAPALLLTYAIMGVGVYVGFLMLILPGVWLYIRLSLSAFLVTLEGLAPIEAVQTSFERTAGSIQWQLLLALLFLALLVFSAVNLVGGAAQSALGEHAGLDLALSILAALGGTLLSVLIFRFYGLTRPSPTDGE